MRLTSRGRLGIGTTDPKELLHVRGKTIIDSTIEQHQQMDFMEMME